MAYPSWVSEQVVGRDCFHCDRPYDLACVIAVGAMLRQDRHGDPHDTPAVSVAVQCPNCQHGRFLYTDAPESEVRKAVRELYRRSATPSTHRDANQQRGKPTYSPKHPMRPSNDRCPDAPIEAWELAWARKLMSRVRFRPSAPSWQRLLKKIIEGYPADHRDRRS